MTLIKAPIDVNNKVHQFRVIKITTFYSTAGIFIHFNHLSKQTNSIQSLWNSSFRYLPF